MANDEFDNTITDKQAYNQFVKPFEDKAEHYEKVADTEYVGEDNVEIKEDEEEFYDDYNDDNPIELDDDDEEDDPA